MTSPSTETEIPEVLAHKLDCSTWRELRAFADEMRNNWRTEQEMHAAWRKRAMEAEAEIRSLRSPGGASEQHQQALDRACYVIMELMQAYERRIRSDCTTPEQLAANPWECAEYIKAERFLKAIWKDGRAQPFAALDEFLGYLRTAPEPCAKSADWEIVNDFLERIEFFEEKHSGATWDEARAALNRLAPEPDGDGKWITDDQLRRTIGALLDVAADMDHETRRYSEYKALYEELIELRRPPETKGKKP